MITIHVLETAPSNRTFSNRISSLYHQNRRRLLLRLPDTARVQGHLALSLEYLQFGCISTVLPGRSGNVYCCGTLADRPIGGSKCFVCLPNESDRRLKFRRWIAHPESAESASFDCQSPIYQATYLPISLICADRTSSTTISLSKRTSKSRNVKSWRHRPSPPIFRSVSTSSASWRTIELNASRLF